MENLQGFEYILEMAINPLHEVMLIASTLQEILQKEHGGKTQILPELDLAYSYKFKIATFDRDAYGNVLYPTKETAGVAGLYVWLKKMGYELIFANDFSLDIHGIDAVALDKKTGEYVICEAKGSSLPKIKSFSSYLKKTKNKGRQLSYEWCWASLIDYAFQASTSGIFIKLVEPIIMKKIKRLLCVSLLNKTIYGYTVRETKVWREAEMNEKAWFKESYDLAKQLDWYKEIVTLAKPNISFKPTA
ncbi:MAG: hypothetical protein HQK72_13540 [Desulfamplus sp.]|nr:hypothetical protein [Desulfamplus sp.]